MGPLRARLQPIKWRAIAWLARQIDVYRAGQERRLVAIIDRSALIFPEAQIENLSGLPERIVVGSNTAIRGRLHTFPHGGSVRVGNWCYVGHRSEIWSMSSVEIGDRVLVSHDVNIIDSSSHSLDPVERAAHYEAILKTGHPRTASELPGIHSDPIVIEDDVWISFGVKILRGVRIGARSVIAAGSIVTKDVPPDTLYRCKVVPDMRPLPRSRRTVGLPSRPPPAALTL